MHNLCYGWEDAVMRLFYSRETKKRNLLTVEYTRTTTSNQSQTVPRDVSYTSSTPAYMNSKAIHHSHLPQPHFFISHLILPSLSLSSLLITSTPNTSPHNTTT
ncbi:hypothetical protein RIF29_26936 [Crotalaria pallida]|uniref:Uncharacterized protein n=1 Tax=Crotalaria pallida TaxID=3830 RepID=A0AAN9EN92_CROPI